MYCIKIYSIHIKNIFNTYQYYAHLFRKYKWFFIKILGNSCIIIIIIKSICKVWTDWCVGKETQYTVKGSVNDFIMKKINEKRQKGYVDAEPNKEYKATSVRVSKPSVSTKKRKQLSMKSSIKSSKKYQEKHHRKR